jgi:hypothetical protein
MLHEHTIAPITNLNLFLITADFLSILPSLFLSLANPLPLPIQQLPQILGHIKSTTSISPTIRTLLPTFRLVSLQRTSLAKVMTTLRDHRTLVRFLANDAREWNFLKFFCFFVVVRV